MEYLIIDEMSMVGRKMFGQIDKRLRQAFPHQADVVLGGCSCLLFGDFGQLPPVMDLPLYTTMPRTALSDLGSSCYQLFNKVVVLNQVMRQSGQDHNQVLFRDILMRLRNGQVTLDDWNSLMHRTPAQVRNIDEFGSALHLYPTVEAVVEHNIAKLHSNRKPIANIEAVHRGPNASKASPDDAAGLEPTICLAHGARVMLTTNLWVEVGLVNGAVGTVIAICYKDGTAPPSLPVAVTVKFDSYSGPTLNDGTVPITPLSRTWSTAGVSCSRQQLPLKLAWAVTIHKAQGLTLDKVVIDIGKKEFSSGLTFVACSRVRHMQDLLFTPPFTYDSIANLGKSRRLEERVLEDRRLLTMEGEPTCDNPCPHTYVHLPSPGTSSSPRSMHTTVSPTNMDSPTPSPPHSPSHMYSPTPSPPPAHSHMDSPTPSPPFSSSNVDSPTLSPPPFDYNMDSPTPSPPPSPSHMNSPTPSPPFSPFNIDSPYPLPSYFTDSPTPSPPPLL